MSRSARMFEIIQLLRSAPHPLTAADIAETLEVTKRTIYRDVASLQAMRVPIDGAAGIGYIMRPGFDLPPINFDIDEAEAITVGLSLLGRTGDKGLIRAARRAAAKLASATPLRDGLYTSSWGGVPEEATLDLSEIRNAIRQAKKVFIRYGDEDGILTERTIRPIAMVYFTESVIVAAWCELRDDFRHFRPDRFSDMTVLETDFLAEAHRLRREWAQTNTDWLR